VIEVSATKEDVIWTGLNKNFVRLVSDNNTEDILITCTKARGFPNGTLGAFVNTFEAEPLPCQLYDPTQLEKQPSHCLKQTFRFTIEPDSDYLYFEIWCRTHENGFDDGVKTFIYRICEFR